MTWTSPDNTVTLYRNRSMIHVQLYKYGLYLAEVRIASGIAMAYANCPLNAIWKALRRAVAEGEE